MNKIKVLLVDDEIDFITPLSKRLERRGLDTRTVSNGREALDVLEENSTDIVLLDIKMEGMDGIKTLSEIKQRHPHVEVVMLTAHANPDIVISSLTMGAYDYLMKPAQLDELVLKIEDAALRRNRNLTHDGREQN